MTILSNSNLEASIPLVRILHHRRGAVLEARKNVALGGFTSKDELPPILRGSILWNTAVKESGITLYILDSLL